MIVFLTKILREVFQGEAVFGWPLERGVSATVPGAFAPDHPLWRLSSVGVGSTPLPPPVVRAFKCLPLPNTPWGANCLGGREVLLRRVRHDTWGQGAGAFPTCKQLFFPLFHAFNRSLTA